MFGGCCARPDLSRLGLNDPLLRTQQQFRLAKVCLLGPSFLRLTFELGSTTIALRTATNTAPAKAASASSS